MAQVQTNDQGGGGKNKQKKQTLRVDFTPMVDMNMLLITFFMLCTTLLTPQAMNLNMPTKDDVKEEDRSKIKESSAITLLLGADNQLYYYEGRPTEESYEDPEFLHISAYGAGENGIRNFLIARNRGSYEEIRQLAIQRKNLEINEDQYNEKVKEIHEQARKNNTAPVVIIKPADQSSYRNMVDALDEMAIANIGSYTIVELEDGDRHLMFKKTNDTEYLTEQQRADLGS